MSKEENNKNHKVEGVGGYGCVVNPALAFKDEEKQKQYQEKARTYLGLKKYDNKKFVSKLMPYALVMQELKFSKEFTYIDPNGEYHIQTLAIGQVEDGVGKIVEEFDKECKSKMTSFATLLEKMFNLKSTDINHLRLVSKYLNEKLNLKEKDKINTLEENTTKLKEDIQNKVLKKFALPVKNSKGERYGKDKFSDENYFDDIYKYLKEYKG